MRRLGPSLLLVLLVVAALASAAGASPRAGRLDGLPRVMLWAWERPERLESIDPQVCGVAWLAGTITLSGDAVVLRPRMQPLAVPPGTRLLAVARVEVDARRRPALDARQRERLAGTLVALARRPGSAGLQIDFDAARSERGFYRALLADVRAGLPDTLGLSMTALASWALGDAWLADLPVDEVVPMAFRMGADDSRVRLRLARGGDFAPARCRVSVGLATDEPAPALRSPRRVYLFHPRPWSAAAVHDALTRLDPSHTASQPEE